MILSHYFGGRFTYVNSVENRFGLPSRTYHSFAEAATEAAQSRFCGGIHFEDAVTNGLEQGHNVGNWVLMKLNSDRKRLITHRTDGRFYQSGVMAECAQK